MSGFPAYAGILAGMVVSVLLFCCMFLLLPVSSRHWFMARGERPLQGRSVPLPPPPKCDSAELCASVLSNATIVARALCQPGAPCPVCLSINTTTGEGCEFPAPTSPDLDRQIIVARYQEDVSWLLLYVADVAPIIVYTRADPASPFDVSPNKGKEALVYLHYIITHYDHLPKAMAFIHGHRSSWHMEDAVPILRKLRWDLPYASLNAKFFQVVGESHEEYRFVRAAWKDAFGDELGPFPATIPNHCCAQFVVSRERVLSRSKAFYQHIYDWLVSTPMSDHTTSRVLEYNWAGLFHAAPEQPYPNGVCDVVYC